MKLTQNTNMCDLCGKPRSRGIDHSACSKLRQAQGFAGKKIGEKERISNARRVAKNYANGTYRMPD